MLTPLALLAPRPPSIVATVVGPGGRVRLIGIDAQRATLLADGEPGPPFGGPGLTAGGANRLVLLDGIGSKATVWASRVERGRFSKPKPVPAPREAGALATDEHGTCYVGTRLGQTYRLGGPYGGQRVGSTARSSADLMLGARATYALDITSTGMGDNVSELIVGGRLVASGASKEFGRVTSVPGTGGLADFVPTSAPLGLATIVDSEHASLQSFARAGLPSRQVALFGQNPGRLLALRGGVWAVGCGDGTLGLLDPRADRAGWLDRVRFPEPLEYAELREIPGAIVVASGRSGRIWSVPLTRSRRFGKIRPLIDLGPRGRMALSYVTG